MHSHHVQQQGTAFCFVFLVAEAPPASHMPSLLLPAFGGAGGLDASDSGPTLFWPRALNSGASPVSLVMQCSREAAAQAGQATERSWSEGTVLAATVA